AAREAVPALKALRKKASPREQVELNDVLWKIAGEDEALTALAALLADRDACATAAHVLGDTGAPAKTAVPALRKQRSNRERTLREGAVIDDALRKIIGKKTEQEPNGIQSSRQTPRARFTSLFRPYPLDHWSCRLSHVCRASVLASVTTADRSHW